jgi:hypothetical protein
MTAAKSWTFRDESLPFSAFFRTVSNARSMLKADLPRCRPETQWRAGRDP